ncbi:mitochondrial carrier [Rhodocollybia butyracea]|uniref:Mitochondrial carrier n=1 Tax=Rhodocollybia butyracea TaxID=206335 RepID=A0A9P5P210_9AGAR|nr:mitochondrial carrier [Rhodocollybia butyracea]
MSQNPAEPKMPPRYQLTPKKKPYPFWLGGVACYDSGLPPATKRMLASIRKTVATAGVRGLFDGITGTWMRQMSYSMCRFWAYEESKKIVIGPDPTEQKNAPAWKLALSGSMAGGIAGFVGNPGGASLVMVREEGASSLARGVGPNVFRAILMNASQLASYDFFKAELLKTAYFEDNIIVHFTASFAAGTVATTVCSPADVLKSRIMNASGPGSSSTIGAIRTAIAQEGPMFMFKGWVPAWMRLQPTTILIFLTLEQLKNGWIGRGGRGGMFCEAL